MFRRIEWGDETSDDWVICEDTGDGTGRHVAHVAHINQGERAPEVELANASLIAAAPELLEALRKIMIGWSSAISIEAEEQALHAIVKATGNTL